MKINEKSLKINEKSMKIDGNLRKINENQRKLKMPGSGLGYKIIKNERKSLMNGAEAKQYQGCRTPNGSPLGKGIKFIIDKECFILN